MGALEQLIYAQDFSPVAEKFSPVRDRMIAELEDVNTLCATHRSRIYRYALLSLRDPDLAENVTQDCFLKAHKARREFRGDCSVATWLTRIATNLIRDTTRSRKFQFWKAATTTAVDAGAMADRLRSPGLSPESSLVVREELLQVWDTVATLSGKQRSVFLLRFVEEMELPEIATAMGLHVGTVKSHLHRALTAVRKAMERTG
jgi:RNA polymerase sigma-70 factor (ECF subfamily)